MNIIKIRNFLPVFRWDYEINSSKLLVKRETKSFYFLSHIILKLKHIRKLKVYQFRIFLKSYTAGSERYLDAFA